MNTKPILRSDSIVVRSPDHVSGELDGELILLAIDKGKYYHLEAVGHRIWEMLEHPISPSVLVDQLLAEFAVARPECEADVLAFLEELQAEGLVSVKVGDSAG